MLADVLTLFLIAGGIIIAAIAIHGLRTDRWWLYWLMAIIGGLWAALYVFVLVADPANYNSARFAATYIRPLIVLSVYMLAWLLWLVVRYVRR